MSTAPLHRRDDGLRLRRSPYFALMRGLAVGHMAVALALVLAPRTASPQRLPIKATLVAGGPSGCAAYPAPPASNGSPRPAAGDDAEARRYISDGQEAALQGDHQAARDAFTKAAARAPANARLAYYLGREHEALDSATAAVREYCRYLALSPTAPDGDEVRGRIVRLVPASEISRVDEARANFRSGVTLLERHQFVTADSVFSTIIRQLPSAAEAYYNRGLSRAARGERAPAVEDFEKYLELVPTASDRGAIRSTIAQLPDRVYGSNQALTSGLVVPGLGQMSTGRPVFGVAVLGGVLGAALWGLKTESKTELQQFTDPFGNPYTQQVTTQERPNLVIGAAVAAALWIGAAVEAMFYARGTRERAEEIIQPSSGGVRTTDVRSDREGWRRGAVVAPYIGGDPIRGISAGLSLSFGR